MDYLGPIDLTLIYSSPGLETTTCHPGVTATLFYNQPQRAWSVMMDQPINLENGLIRAELTLTDGRRIVGATRRPSALGNAFEVIEDGQP